MKYRGSRFTDRADFEKAVSFMFKEFSERFGERGYDTITVNNVEGERITFWDHARTETVKIELKP